jgi:FKBP-type peptidyl-prolyl cis-trans isomerase
MKLSENPYVRKTAIYVIVFTVGAAAGYFSLPAKVVTKTETKIVEKIVEVRAQDKKERQNVRIVETKKPDGTVVKTTEIIKEKDTKTNVATNTDRTEDNKTEKTVEYSKDGLLISVTASTNLDRPGLSYGAEVQRRLFGPLWLGAHGSTDKTFGMSLGVSF